MHAVVGYIESTIHSSLDHTFGTKERNLTVVLGNECAKMMMLAA